MLARSRRGEVSGSRRLRSNPSNSLAGRGQTTRPPVAGIDRLIGHATEDERRRDTVYVPPSPSCPSALLPQQSAVRSSVSAHVWLAPATML